MSTAYDEPPSLSLGPNDRRVWTAAAASNPADGIFWMTLPLIAVTLTTEPALVAGVAVAAQLPWIFFVLARSLLGYALAALGLMLVVGPVERAHRDAR